MVEYEH
jgi:hypothetical protein